MTLNPAQAEAVRYLDGPLLVLAGAGSGKTRVITQKIAHLIQNCQMAPARIAAITFTNKAAEEMKERVAHLLKGTPEDLTVATFHALGLRILKEEAAALGYKKNFSILDSKDAFAMIAELSGTTDKSLIYRLQAIISHWKNTMVTPNEAKHQAGNAHETLAAQLFESYLATQKAWQAVDFDDLIALPVTLFQENADVRQKWQSRFSYLLMDEYQDTNAAQYRLVKALTGSRAAFTAVGDDDQAIYGWRGADVANLRALPSDYPNLKVILLEQNYRSSRVILRAANTLIASNTKLFDKKLWSDLGEGVSIIVTACEDPETEAASVLSRIKAHQTRHKSHWSDYAVLYRSHFQARIFEEVFRKANVPYQVSGGQSFFERAEIRDLLSYLRLLLNPNDEPAFLRALATPKRGIGPTTLEALSAYAQARHCSLFEAAQEAGVASQLQARQHAALLHFCDFMNRLIAKAKSASAEEVMSTLLDAISYESWLHTQEERTLAKARWENVQDFVTWLIGREEEGKSRHFLDLIQELNLNAPTKKNEEANRAVRFSTLHAAKGLEFPHVFLIGVEEDILPHRESLTGEKLEEERRLMYVGITRAQQTLVISYAKKRRVGKEIVKTQASRFIREMGKEGIETLEANTLQLLSQNEARERLAALRKKSASVPF